MTRPPLTCEMWRRTSKRSRSDSPLLSSAEQCDGLVDTSLPGLSGLRAVDVVDVIPLKTVGELAEEGAGRWVGRESGLEVVWNVDLAGRLGDGQPDRDRIPGLQPGGLADRGADTDHVPPAHHGNGVPVLV